MKTERTIKPAKVEPDIGSTRTVSRFAWLPKRARLHDGPPVWVWLESYLSVEEYQFEGALRLNREWQVVRRIAFKNH